MLAWIVEKRAATDPGMAWIILEEFACANEEVLSHTKWGANLLPAVLHDRLVVRLLLTAFETVLMSHSK